MGLSVQCACGNPLEGENLDLVVTLTCPHCRRELTLELDDVTGTSRRPVLTVTQGPHWVGEQFVVPLGIELNIGRGLNNWLALEDDSISDVHCRVRLLPDGGLLVEDQKSTAGTWVGQKRIARGKLVPTQTFRLGDFQLRLDLRAIEAPKPAPQQINLQEDVPSVRLDVTRREPAAFRWLVRNRFQVSRLCLWVGAWLMGVYHAIAWHGPLASWQRWLGPIAGAVVITGALLAAGSRVSLAHRHFKYASLIVLVVLAIVDLAFMFSGPAIACLCLAACLTILVMRVPTGIWAALSVVVGLMGLIILFCATISRLTALFTAQ